MPSGFNLPNQYDSVKYLTMDTKKEKKNTKQQKTDSEDELARVSPSEQNGLKYILVAVYAVPVLIRYAWKQCCFKGCFFMTQLLKIRKCCKCYHFKRVSGGICVSSLVYAFQYLRRLVRVCSDLLPSVLFVCDDSLPPNRQF